MGLDSLITALILATGQIDANRILAHADTVRLQTGIYFPDAAALALTWQETRSGKTKNSDRGPGVWKSKSTGKLCRSFDCVPGDSIRVCREIGRMQLSPCQKYVSLDPRCTLKAIIDSLDVNMHCGLLWYVEKIKLCKGDVICGIERYNGNGCIKLSSGKTLCSHQYRQEALAYIGLLYLRGWREQR
jgi:hypothetical protein